MTEAGKLEESIDFWAGDAVMLPPDMPMLSGKAEIREYVMGAASIPGFRISWAPESTYVSESGDIAYLIERNLTERDGEDGQKIEIPGKVVTIWRRESNGEWKNVVEIWNAARIPENYAYFPSWRLVRLWPKAVIQICRFPVPRPSAFGNSRRAGVGPADPASFPRSNVRFLPKSRHSPVINLNDR